MTTFHKLLTMRTTNLHDPHNSTEILLWFYESMESMLH